MPRAKGLTVAGAVNVGVGVGVAVGEIKVHCMLKVFCAGKPEQ